MHNAFNARGKPFHPVRICLHVFFYKHLAVNEYTVTHLTEDGAVFNQILGLAQNGLQRYLGMLYQNLVYGRDCDFKVRKSMYQGDVPKHSRLSSDLEYYNAFFKY